MDFLDWFEEKQENEIHFEQLMVEHQDKNNQILKIMDEQLLQFKNYTSKCKDKISLLNQHINVLQRQRNHINHILLDLSEEYDISELKNLINDSDTSSDDESD